MERAAIKEDRLCPSRRHAGPSQNRKRVRRGRCSRTEAPCSGWPLPRRSIRRSRVTARRHPLGQSAGARRFLAEAQASGFLVSALQNKCGRHHAVSASRHCLAGKARRIRPEKPASTTEQRMTDRKPILSPPVPRAPIVTIPATSAVPTAHRYATICKGGACDKINAGNGATNTEGNDGVGTSATRACGSSGRCPAHFRRQDRALNMVSGF